jgi:hypothetical protein
MTTNSLKAASSRKVPSSAVFSESAEYNQTAADPDGALNRAR